MNEKLINTIEYAMFKTGISKIELSEYMNMSYSIVFISFSFIIKLYYNLN